MPRRTYDQACTVAESLDVIGERWTLLIVRELMLGPRRFTQLLDNLPGIGRNLLTARLRHLEEEGLVVRGEAYTLTEDGRALGPAMAELGRWGVRRRLSGAARQGTTFRAAWAMFPLSYMADAEAARGVRETYEFRVGDEVFHLRVDDGRVEPHAGPADAADLVITMDLATLLDLFSDATSAVEALGAGRIGLDGPPEALQHALAILAGPG